MKIEICTPEQIPQLLTLWKQAFGDHGGFWEMFLETAFQKEHCRCITENSVVTAALYWFDCLYAGQKCAYLYAVVTHPEHRGKGLCRKLIENTHQHLLETGYHSVLLVPENEGLRQMYRKMGYQDCTSVNEFSCSASPAAIPLRAIGPEEYAAVRQTMLPPGSVIQEGNNLAFLAAQAQFFAGETCLLAAYVEEDTLHCMEFLGSREQAAKAVTSLQCRQGHFRCPGQDKAFAMFHPLTADAQIPSYFGLAFD